MVTQAPQRNKSRQRRDLTEQVEDIPTNNDLEFSDSESESDTEEPLYSGPLRMRTNDDENSVSS
jgi:hypothetical protein